MCLVLVTSEILLDSPLLLFEMSLPLVSHVVTTMAKALLELFLFVFELILESFLFLFEFLLEGFLLLFGGPLLFLPFSLGMALHVPVLSLELFSRGNAT